MAIASVYREMLQISPPRIFQVEPKYEKGLPEPDIFTIWAGRAFWIEVQRNVFSQKVWLEKFQRYINFFRNGRWREESWQPKDKKVFPYIWILSASRVPVPDGLPFPVLQSRSVNELLSKKPDTA
nr:replication-relaxation family protein [Brevibacillus massiliensis]